MTPAKVAARKRKPKAQRKLIRLDSGSAPGLGSFLEAPIMTFSEQNEREHHMARSRRRKAQRSGLAMLLRPYMTRPTSYPVTVTLTRIAPRRLDEHDDLRWSLKACADAVADWLEIDDGDELIVWKYAQEKREPRTYGVRVELHPPAGAGEATNGA